MKPSAQVHEPGENDCECERNGTRPRFQSDLNGKQHKRYFVEALFS